MKKFAIIAASIFLTIALVAPSMAATLEVGGHMRARGFYKSNNDSVLTKDALSDAYYDMRFRPEITFKVNDKVWVNSRVAVFDETFGKTGATLDNDGNGKGDSATWDRGWITINSDNFGRFDIGRMSGGLFGLDLFDNERVADRVKWSQSYDLGGATFKVLALTEKSREDEYNDTNASLNTVEADKDVYALAGIYNAGNIEAGLLLQNVRDESDDGTTVSRDNYINPYFKGQFDNIGVKAEIMMRSGELENKDGTTPATNKDRGGLGYYFAVNAAFGPATVELGYASASGDQTVDEKNEALPNGLGSEWTPLVILQDANAILDTMYDNSYGVNLIYLQADYKLSDDISLTGVLGSASANEVATGAEDDYGMEIDAKLAWKLMDGVTYYFNLGYLSAGDFFGTEPENTYTAYHTIQVDF